MKTAIISSAELVSEPGAPLNAAYWITRQPGESYDQWKRRTAATEHLARARRHMARAVASLSRAASLLEEEVTPHAERP